MTTKKRTFTIDEMRNIDKELIYMQQEYDYGQRVRFNQIRRLLGLKESYYGNMKFTKQRLKEEEEQLKRGY